LIELVHPPSFRSTTRPFRNSLGILPESVSENLQENTREWKNERENPDCTGKGARKPGTETKIIIQAGTSQKFQSESPFFLRDPSGSSWRSEAQPKEETAKSAKN
jgi:hypothetical protein